MNDELKAQNERQAETIKAQWVQITRLKKRCEIQQRIIDCGNRPETKTKRERLIDEANALFGGEQNGQG